MACVDWDQMLHVNQEVYNVFTNFWKNGKTKPQKKGNGILVQPPRLVVHPPPPPPPIRPNPIRPNEMIIQGRYSLKNPPQNVGTLKMIP